MAQSQPRSIADAGRVLLTALLQLAEERRDVREALLAVTASLTERPSRNGGGVRAEPELAEKILTQGDERRVVDAGHEKQITVDLGLVVRRARWKAAACRLAVDRRKAESSPEIKRLEQALRAQREELEDCFAWMLDSPRPLPPDERLVETSACYEGIALAAEWTKRLDDEGALDPAPPAELLYLLAEAQSMLLAALGRVDLRGDSDQRDLFLWLKDQTTRHRIYVDRHMRLDDPADPTESESLARRLDEVGRDVLGRFKLRTERGQLLSKMRYHARKMLDAGESSDYDWRAIAGALERWLEVGFATTDRSLRDVLAPLGSTPPNEGEVSQAVARVLAETAATASGPSRARPSSGQDGAEITASRLAALEQAAELLTGRSISVIASEDPGDALDHLVEKLNLSGARWVTLGEDLETEMEGEIGDPGIDLVLIATRLPQEAYADFKTRCKEHDKPFVRLPNGLEPPQVAHQVIRQIGWRLRQSAAPTK